MTWFGKLYLFLAGIGLGAKVTKQKHGIKDELMSDEEFGAYIIAFLLFLFAEYTIGVKKK